MFLQHQKANPLLRNLFKVWLLAKKGLEDFQSSKEITSSKQICFVPFYPPISKVKIGNYTWERLLIVGSLSWELS